MNISSFTALSLKLIGVIFIVSSLIDMITYAIPFQWQNPQWQVAYVTRIVDSGIVPLVGIAFMLVGYWVDRSSETPNSKVGLDLRVPTFVLSIILGGMFLIFVPIHLNNLNQAKNTALEQIKQGAGQGEQQIQAFLAQVNTFSQNPKLLDQEIAGREQALQAGQIQGRPLNTQQLAALKQQTDQLKQLRDLAKNPKDFAKRIKDIKTQLQTRQADEQKNLESQTKIGAVTQGLRTGLSSLMLSFGYVAIPLLGFNTLGGKKSRSKSS